MTGQGASRMIASKYVRSRLHLTPGRRSIDLRSPFEPSQPAAPRDPAAAQQKLFLYSCMFHDIPEIRLRNFQQIVPNSGLTVAPAYTPGPTGPGMYDDSCEWLVSLFLHLYSSRQQLR
jgi:hypothetical protein